MESGWRSPFSQKSPHLAKNVTKQPKIATIPVWWQKIAVLSRFRQNLWIDKKFGFVIPFPLAMERGWRSPFSQKSPHLAENVTKQPKISSWPVKSQKKHVLSRFRQNLWIDKKFGFVIHFPLAMESGWRSPFSQKSSHLAENVTKQPKITSWPVKRQKKHVLSRFRQN